MAIPIFENLITLGGVDIIGIYTQDGGQIFSSARPIRVFIKEDAKVMEHPLETGATITDHIVINSLEISLSVFLKGEDYQNVYCSIRKYFIDGTLTSIQLKTGLYYNMLLASMPHEESNEYWDVIPIELRFRQVVFAQNNVEGVSPKNANDSSTAKRGNLQTQTPAPDQERRATLAKRIFRSAGASN